MQHLTILFVPYTASHATSHCVINLMRVLARHWSPERILLTPLPLSTHFESARRDPFLWFLELHQAITIVVSHDKSTNQCYSQQENRGNCAIFQACFHNKIFSRFSLISSSLQHLTKCGSNNISFLGTISPFNCWF